MRSLRKFIQIHRSIKQHATRFSLVVVIMLFGLFMEAYMHDFNLVYITLFFVFALAFSAGPIGVLNLGNLKASFSKQGRMFVNTETYISINIENNSTTPSWSITLYGEGVLTTVSKISAESTAILKLPFLPKKRGSFTYENCYLESRYPLSTARLTKPVHDTYHGVVYPEPKGKSLQSYVNEQEAHYGEEKEFDGLHAYDGSQKLSHIHWASVAKGEISVKMFTKETEISNLTFNYITLNGDKEKRLSQLCLWVLECEKKHLGFTLILPNKRFISHKESIDDILEALARY